MDSILNANLMGIKVVFTDHSTWAIDTPLIHCNQLYKAHKVNIDHVICVSHAVRENFIIKANF